MIAPSFFAHFLAEMNAVHGSQNFFPFSSENDAAQLIKRVGGQGALTIQRKEVEPCNLLFLLRTVSAGGKTAVIRSGWS